MMHKNVIYENNRIKRRGNAYENTQQIRNKKYRVNIILTGEKLKLP